MNAIDMLNGIDLTMEQLTKIKEMAEAKLDELTPKELEPTKQWKPKGDEWSILSEGSIIRCGSTSGCRNFGTEYATKELAEKARDAMRIHNRLLAYRAEFAPDWEPDWNSKRQPKYYVYYCYDTHSWNYGHGYSIKHAVNIYMPRQVARDLVKKLNSGEVVL